MIPRVFSHELKPTTKVYARLGEKHLFVAFKECKLMFSKFPDNVGTYQVNWPGNTVHLKVLPENLWVDTGHESNGVAGYGFFLGLWGLYVAWRQRRRQGKVNF